MSLSKNKYVVLARREYWEHRSLWMAPAIVSVAMLVLPLVGGGINLRGGRGITINPDDPTSPPVVNVMFGAATMVGTMVLLSAVTGLAVFTYLLDCLYGERKDRSILFWKSLPVSDAETVLTKLAVGLVLTPLFAALLAVIVQPLLLGVLALRVPGAAEGIDFGSVWSGWRLLPGFAMIWFYGLLWYAPFNAWLLLASVMAKRVPLMYALMPPLVLILVEGIVLQGGYIAQFLGRWFFPWRRAEWNWDVEPARGMLPSLSANWSAMYAEPALWIGLALAAGMVYIVIRLRRYRDDT